MGTAAVYIQLSEIKKKNLVFLYPLLQLQGYIPSYQAGIATEMSLKLLCFRHRMSIGNHSPIYDSL